MVKPAKPSATFTAPFIFLLCATMLLAACHSNTSTNQNERDLSKIKKGMSYTQVLELAGFPDEKIDVGIVTDEFNHQTKTEEWHYGDNEIIVMVNDTVNSIDLNAKRTYDKIRHIIDSAKAAGDSSSLIQPLR